MELQAQKRNADDGELSEWMDVRVMFPEAIKCFESDEWLETLVYGFKDGSSLTFRKAQ